MCCVDNAPLYSVYCTTLMEQTHLSKNIPCAATVNNVKQLVTLCWGATLQRVILSLEITFKKSFLFVVMPHFQLLTVLFCEETVQF